MTIPAMMMMGQLQKQPHREAAAAVNSENLEEETEHDDNYYWDDVEEEYKRNPDGEEWRWYGRRYAKSSHDTFTTDQGKDDDIITDSEGVSWWQDPTN